MFKNLLKFEFIKSFQKNYVGVGMLVLLIVSGLLFYFQDAQATAYQQEYRKGLQSEIEMYTNRISELEYEFENSDDSDRITEIAGSIIFFTSSIERFNEELDVLTSFSTQEYLSWYIEKIETYNFMNYSYTDFRVTDSTRQEMTLILDTEAVPMTPLNFIYLDSEEQFYTEEELELWQEQNPRFYNFGLYYIWYLLKEQAFLIFLALVIILFGSFLRSERTSKRHSLDFLYTQSMTSTKILFSKYLVSLGQSLLLLFTFVLGVLGLGTLINGFGSWEYPVNRFIPGEGIQPPERIFIPLSEYLRDNFILIIVGLVFILSVIYFFNILFKNEITVIFVGLITLVGGSLLPVHPYNPFTYLNTSAIVTGKHMYQLNDYAYSLQTGVLLLTGLSLIFMFINTLLVKRTDLR